MAYTGICQKEEGSSGLRISEDLIQEKTSEPVLEAGSKCSRRPFEETNSIYPDPYLFQESDGSYQIKMKEGGITSVGAAS